MKKYAFAVAAATMLLSAAFCFTGCGGPEGTITKVPNEGVSQGVPESVGEYDETVYFEREAPADVRIDFHTKSIRKVSYKYRTLRSGEYSFNGNVLTVDSKVFEGESAGDKRLRVFVENNFVEVTVRVVTKVIYTTEDFDAIRNDLNGVYVLGADIDFANAPFWPIGKSFEEGGKTATFEGIFDGMGHAVKNITINAYDNAVGEDGSNQGPSLGDKVSNAANYNNGIFMSTGGSAQILNTDFVNISIECQGLGGAVVGANGGIIKNCRVSCSLHHHSEWAEHAGGIAGVNGSSDAAGTIENCIVVYSTHGGDRGIADWNPGGIIKNCYAAVSDDYVFHIAYDSETKSVPEGFDYDEWVLGGPDRWRDLLGWNSIPAFPGSVDTAQGIFYKGGDIINSDVVRKEFLLDPANFPEEDGWDREIWNFAEGQFPTLKVQN